MTTHVINPPARCFPLSLSLSLHGRGNVLFGLVHSPNHMATPNVLAAFGEQCPSPNPSPLVGEGFGERGTREDTAHHAPDVEALSAGAAVLRPCAYFRSLANAAAMAVSTCGLAFGLLSLPLNGCPAGCWDA